MKTRGPRPRAMRSAFHWRKVAREDGLAEELGWIHCPELADLVIGHDGLVDQFVAMFLDATHIDVDHHVSVVVEADRSARRIRQRYRADGFDELVRVVEFAAGLREGSLDHLAVDVEACSVVTDPDISAVVLTHRRDESLVRL